MMLVHFRVLKESAKARPMHINMYVASNTN